MSKKNLTVYLNEIKKGKHIFGDYVRISTLKYENYVFFKQNLLNI